MQIEIDAEEIRNAAVQKAVDEAMAGESLSDLVAAEIGSRVDEFMKETANKLMEETLHRELEALMTRKIQPMNTWGEPVGETFTLREELQRRAEEFWLVKVKDDGTPSSYGGKPRHQQMYELIAKDQFAAAIREEIEVVIEGFKQALRKDAGQMLGEHIERFIKAPKRR